MIWQLLTPLLIFAVAFYALTQKTDVFGGFLAGAGEGLGVLRRILPALVTLLAALAMLRSSGFLDAFAEFCRPAFTLMGIPPECAPLIIVRPFSGGGALALGAELIAAHGPDSTVGRVTAVMLGSTETTFYAVSVICGAAGVSKTRYIIPAALLADFTGYLMAAWSVRFIFGG